MEHLPKRRDLKKLKRKTICRFPSTKGDKSVVLTEGVLEKDFCYHLEFDNDVVEYQSQPLGYYYYMEDGKHGYTPDFKVLVNTAEGRSELYYEIKERKYLEEDFEVEFKAKQWPPKNIGKDLILVDDFYIRKQPRLTNLKRVYAAKRRGFPDDVLIKAVTSVFESSEPVTAEILMHLTEISIGQVYQLLYYKIIIADFDKVFEPKMTLWGR